jgi:hypothetical protein
MHGPVGPLRYECGFNENFIFIWMNSNSTFLYRLMIDAWWMWGNTPNEFVTCDGLIGDGGLHKLLWIKTWSGEF